MCLQIEINYSELSKDFFGDVSIREILARSGIEPEMAENDEEDDDNSDGEEGGASGLSGSKTLGTSSRGMGGGRRTRTTFAVNRKTV